MGAYFARGIIEGRMTYTQVFSISLYLVYKEETDNVLIERGHEDLIVEL